MSQDFLYLGPTPSEEDCIGVGYDPLGQIAECRRYTDVLRKMFPDYKNHGCSFALRTEYGHTDPQREVVIYFDTEREDSIDFAFNVEGNQPTHWESGDYFPFNPFSDKEWP